MKLLVCALMALAIAPGRAQAPSARSTGLKIVVLTGEDAVNVIQQKTAVAPIVAVRDRNNLPVPGAVVTFAVEGGKAATFAGGVPTLTVTTNAAGQAVAAGLSPLTSGAVQINVQAVFQGQTIATTIAQTNVLTAAEAAQAAAVGASGGGGTTGGGAAGAAGGGGGGLSATTIGLVGAAVGGGALAAIRVGGEKDGDQNGGKNTGEGKTFTGTFSGPMTFSSGPCTRLETISGTLKIALTTNAGGAVSGTAEINGTGQLVSLTNCTQPASSRIFGMDSTPVNGTAANLGFSFERSHTDLPSSDSVGGVVTETFVFSGALNGAEITGTLTYRIRMEPPAPGVLGTGAATFSVTLR